MKSKMADRPRPNWTLRYIGIFLAFLVKDLRIITKSAAAYDVVDWTKVVT